MQFYHNKTLHEIFQITRSSPKGLNQLDAETRLKAEGENTLVREKKQNYFLKFLSQFKDIMVIILLCAAIVSLVFSIVQKSSTELIDAVIIFVIVLINATLGFSQELKADKALESLKRMSQPFSVVIRNNKKMKIKTSEIVVGDIVVLEAGDVVPADMYLIESISLKCDESSLTGESISVDKSANLILPEKTSIGDRKNMCFSSTIVSYGRGLGVVVATGKNAEIGKIATMIDKEKDDITPLSASLNKLGEIITFIVLGIAIIIFVVDVIFSNLGYIDSFLTAVAIAVAAIPESLPAVVTIILSLGVMRLAKKNAIVKKLHAVETLGCCEVICSDKTGTITQNKMSVEKVSVGLNAYNLTSFNVNSLESRELIKCMLLCNDASFENSSYLGDPTETALISFCEKFNLLKSDFDKKYKRIGELPFDSTRKLMTSVNIVEDSVYQYTKGAVDELLIKCTHILDNGIVRPITLNDITKINLQNKIMCSEALRVLAYAKKDLGVLANYNKNQKIEECDLVFIGLSGMIDPPRPEVYAAIKKCKSAKMKVVMITGDHKDTASAIAKRLDIISSEKEVVNGSFLDKLSDKELVREIHKYSVFTRVSPEHKVRIIKALKASGKIVAMTGDGVNDAPSIKCADIGIGMGKLGTEVTKEVSNMILADDNFATIIVAVEEGRKIFGNIQKTIGFLLSCNIAEVLAIFTLTLLFPDYVFLSAVQILFINLITDTLPSIALGLDEAERDIMSRPPRNPKESIVSGKVGFNILYQGLSQAIIVILVFVIGVFCFNSPNTASTMAFLTLNFIQLFHMYNVHSNKSIFKDSAFKNKFINLSFLCEIGLFILIAFIPFLSNILGMTPLTPLQWFIVFLSSFLIVPICEIVKFFEEIYEKRKSTKKHPNKTN